MVSSSMITKEDHCTPDTRQEDLYPVSMTPKDPKFKEIFEKMKTLCEHPGRPLFEPLMTMSMFRSDCTFLNAVQERLALLCAYFQSSSSSFEPTSESFALFLLDRILHICFDLQQSSTLFKPAWKYDGFCKQTKYIARQIDATIKSKRCHANEVAAVRPASKAGLKPWQEFLYQERPCDILRNRRIQCWVGGEEYQVPAQQQYIPQGALSIMQRQIVQGSRFIQELAQGLRAKGQDDQADKLLHGFRKKCPKFEMTYTYNSAQGNHATVRPIRTTPDNTKSLVRHHEAGKQAALPLYYFDQQIFEIVAQKDTAIPQHRRDIIPMLGYATDFNTSNRPATPFNFSTIDFSTMFDEWVLDA